MLSWSWSVKLKMKTLLYSSLWLPLLKSSNDYRTYLTPSPTPSAPPPSASSMPNSSSKPSSPGSAPRSVSSTAEIMSPSALLLGLGGMYSKHSDSLAYRKQQYSQQWNTIGNKIVETLSSNRVIWGNKTIDLHPSPLPSIQS